MALPWFVIWFVADHLGDRAPLLLAPANAWVVTLPLAIALDLPGAHAVRTTGRRA